MTTPKGAVDISTLTAPNRIYSDVDGVLALFLYDYEGTVADYDALGNSKAEVLFAQPMGREFVASLRWNSEIVEAVAELSRREDIDFVWLTSWRDQAPIHLDSLWNIESKGYAPWQYSRSDFSHTFKYEGLEEIEKQSPSRFVWIDDFAITDRHIEKLANERKDEHLLITPDHRQGITMKNIDSIINFFQKDKNEA